MCKTIKQNLLERRSRKYAIMLNTPFVFVVGLIVLGSLNVVSAVTVTNVKNSTSTNLHCCKLFTACRQIKGTFSGGNPNPHFCAYSRNGKFECPMTGAPPAPPALIDSNCRTLVERKLGITALDEFMYLSTADIDNEVDCVVEAIVPTTTNIEVDMSSWLNALFGVSSGTTLSINRYASVTAICVGFLLSVPTLSAI